ncbi:MAG: VIT and VWA domain-containing protein [Candidatus Obscuribacterales bacterium]|nr:VIT and VWA domain-containing protein [Candidatus Obscuribacterales bacterium]
MKTRILPILTVLALLLAKEADAAGMIVIDPFIGTGPRISLPPRNQPPLLKGAVSFGLRLESTQSKVEIVDQVAKTYIIQTFANDTDRNLAGTYLFPLPEDTTFSSFSLHIDGKPVEGKILEAQEARRQYEEIVRAMVDPGLLEHSGERAVRARIFPIPAHGKKKVELEYTQLLKAENGIIKYRFPLRSNSESQTPEGLDLSLRLANKTEIRTIWSPSHKINVHKDNPHKALISLSEKESLPDKDFSLYYSVSDKELACSLLNHKNMDQDGYFLLALTPPAQAKETIQKDVIFAADCSGSMQGQRMEQNKKALSYLVNSLNANDRFSLVTFNTDVEVYSQQLVQATAENKRKALHFIAELTAAGGTNIGDALRTANSIFSLNKERPSYLVLITDGEPTVGETSIPGLLKLVDAQKEIRLFDFGIGYDLNTKLLDKLAAHNHGITQYVEPDENMEVALGSFADKIRNPVLSQVKISCEGVQLKDVYPREIKELFAGSQVMLLGRYRGAGPATLHLSGTVNGKAKAYDFALNFAPVAPDKTYLQRLWAMRRIAHLSEVAQENGNNKEIVDEIVMLSNRYGIISAYTSFLVTEPKKPQGANAPVALSMNKDEVQELRFQERRDFSGGGAVQQAKALTGLKLETVALTPNSAKNGIRTAADKTFYLRHGIWTDSTFSEANRKNLEQIVFASPQYFALVKQNPQVAKYLSIGQRIILVYQNRFYEIIEQSNSKTYR